MDMRGSAQGRVDVTYVKPGQLAAITRMRPQPSERAQEAIARAATRRGDR
ncbi:Uncharacterised protein [Mycobacteroides abscessus subsp. massiliense]|nr:Uncharacterised protein [Mycobacteroides abscessus subsp. massiliense]